MYVELVYALPERAHRVHLELPPGATVDDALAAVSRLAPFSNLDLRAVPVGVHGTRVSRETALTDGDRVEIYRPLAVPPRAARRVRAASD